MKAIVKHANVPDAVELREVPEPQIGPNDALLEVRAAGVCGSDIEMWRNVMTYPVNPPVIQGHEFCGVIAKLGDAVTGWQVGDRVVSETAAHICGTCEFCRSGEYNLCPERLGYGSGTDGAFARYAKVPARCLHRIPDGVEFAEAAITEPLCVGYNAVAVKSHPRPGEALVIIGPGPIGLFCLQIAKLCGAAPLIVVGAAGDDKRLAVAKQLGADIVINTEETNAVEAIMQATGGLGAPLVVDAAGPSTAFRLALDMVRRNGQITKVGWGPKPVGFSLDPLILKAVTLQGAFSHTWRTWETCLRLIASKRVNMRAMISAELPLSEWERGYRMMESKEAIKVILRPGDD